MGSPLRGLVIGIPLSLALWAAGYYVARAGLDVAPPPPDLSSYQTKADAAAQNSVIQSQVPSPCASVPTSDTLMGTVGSANCYVPRDASRPTVVQAGNVQTSVDGSWSVTWARPFSSSSPIVIALPVNGSTSPATCNVALRTASGASGRCWQSSAVNLAAVNTIVTIFATAPTISLMVIAREPTQ
ncbi:hypothetical protein MMB17_18535 [Methylobacterium organophilum]|uniref:hypothetical protein n=1 Tax=Methylobacterium organophilum TaxID=410 RepID=UPI001F1381C2|nr:hypothetical protein [Methylobacterium organophilum]UMY16660.1 hypothetical protein MMB17_18535 [Methylobacterium organophilum]